MEKTVRLTWPEIIKWLSFIALLISSFVANQIDITYLKNENKERKEEIEVLKDQNRATESEVASINQKLNMIGDDVKVIKDAILNRQLNPHGVSR